MRYDTILQNEFVTVIRTDDGLSFRDLTDHYNGYAGFTQAKRGLAKVEAFITALPTETRAKVRMGDVVKLCAQFKLKPHTYCSID